MNEYKIDVKQADVDESKEQVKEYSLDDSNCSLAISFYVKVVEFKQVSCSPVSFCTINYCYTNKVKNSGYSIPCKYFGQNLGKFSYCFDDDVVCKSHEKEYESVNENTNNNYGYFLHNVIRSILKLDFIPSDVEFGDLYL